MALSLNLRVISFVISIVSLPFLLGHGFSNRFGLDAADGELFHARADTTNSLLQDKKEKTDDAPSKETDKQEEETSGLYLTLDHEKKRDLGRAEKLLRRENFNEAFELLDQFQRDTSSEDYFLDPQGGNSLKKRVEKSFSGLSPEGRQAYELYFGFQAQAALENAIQNRDISEIERVSRRFFHSSAGATATMVLGRHHMDHNRPSMAAVCFRRLIDSAHADQYQPLLSVIAALCQQRAGNSQHAQAVLRQVRVTHANQEITLGGQRQTLDFKSGEALGWLEKVVGRQFPMANLPVRSWGVFRGDAARNAIGSGSHPLSRPRWRAVHSVSPSEHSAMRRRFDFFVENGVAPLPAPTPLAVNYVDRQGNSRDVVLFRTPRHLFALDFKSGKALWYVETTFGDEGEPVHYEQDQPLPMPSEIDDNDSVRFLIALNQRTWEDAIYGNITCDGQRVYAIEDLGYAKFHDHDSGFEVNVPPKNKRKNWTEERPHNRLTARSLSMQGKLAWKPLGGEKSPSEPSLAGAFFLGPPLPLMGKLYVLADVRRETRLLVLDPDTGKLLWQQQLMPAEIGIDQDPMRRFAGATPSFRDGLLICPTSSGAVIAIDLARRSFAWEYHYRRPPSGPNSPWRAPVSRYAGDEGDIENLWADATVTIAEDSVLITPLETVEEDEIHCLDLRSGKKRWSKPREEGSLLFIAHVLPDCVVVVGKNDVRGLRLSDGKTTWISKPFRDKSRPLSSGAVYPCGRGFTSGESYYLPLSSGELLQINLSSGAIEKRLRTHASSVLGNLICHRGSVVSYGVDGLAVFHQYDVLKIRVAKALKIDSHDALALARQGEIQLAEGNPEAAITSLRKSYAVRPLASTRQILATTLLDELSDDFVSKKHLSEEIEKYLDLPEDRARYRRIKATALQKAGDVRGAFAEYLAMYEEPPEIDSQVTIVNQGVTVRRDRWAQARIAELYESASEEDRKAIDDAISFRMAKIIGRDSIREMHRFVDYFGFHTQAASAQLALVRELIAAKDLLAAELLLIKLSQCSDNTVAAEALGLLGLILRRQRMNEDARIVYHRLKSDFADTICLDGKTGRQLAVEFGDTSDALPGWPTGAVNHKRGKQHRFSYRDRRQRVFELPIVGPRGPFFQGSTLKIRTDADSTISIQDRYGQRRLEMALLYRNSDYIGDEDSIDVNASYARFRGHFLLVSTGSNLFAIDTLHKRSATGPNSDTTDRILWEKTFASVRQSGSRYLKDYGGSQQRMMPWGERRYQTLDDEGNPIGNTSPITSAGIVYQRGRELFAIDVITGSILWTRRHVAPGSFLIADDKRLYVIAPGRETALVLRMLDGTEIAKKKVPSLMRRMAAYGSQILVWDRTSGQSQKPRIALFDVWNGTYRWTKTVALGSKARRIKDDRVAVLEPDGKFFVISISDGRIILDQQLQKNRNDTEVSSLQSIHLIDSRDAIYLVVNHNTSPDSRKVGKIEYEWPGDPGHHAPLVSGSVHALDKTSGRPLWQTPAKVRYQGFVVHQPEELPVLTFIRHIKVKRSSRGDPYSTKRRYGEDDEERTTSLLMLDKRTGRSVFAEDIKRVTSYNYQLFADPQEHQIHLNLPAHDITVQFTGQPLAPAPSRQLDESNSSNRANGKSTGQKKGGKSERIDPYDDD